MPSPKLQTLWPLEWPDALRLAVEADVGAAGFSHVAATVPDGPVALLGRSEVLVWEAPGQWTSLAPANLELVSAGRLSRRRAVVIGDVLVDVSPGFAERLRELAGREAEPPPAPVVSAPALLAPPATEAAQVLPSAPPAARRSVIGRASRPEDEATVISVIDPTGYVAVDPGRLIRVRAAEPVGIGARVAISRDGGVLPLVRRLVASEASR